MRLASAWYPQSQPHPSCVGSAGSISAMTNELSAVSVELTNRWRDSVVATRLSRAAGCDPGPGFDRAGAAGHERALPRAPAAIRGAGVGGGAGSAGWWG